MKFMKLINKIKKIFSKESKCNKINNITFNYGNEQEEKDFKYKYPIINSFIEIDENLINSDKNTILKIIRELIKRNVYECIYKSLSIRDNRRFQNRMISSNIDVILTERKGINICIEYCSTVPIDDDEKIFLDKIIRYAELSIKSLRTFSEIIPVYRNEFNQHPSSTFLYTLFDGINVVDYEYISDSVFYKKFTMPKQETLENISQLIHEDLKNELSVLFNTPFLKDPFKIEVVFSKISCIYCLDLFNYKRVDKKILNNLLRSSFLKVIEKNPNLFIKK